MGKASGKLTVYFEAPLWVGVFERIEDGKLSVAKVTLTPDHPILKGNSDMHTHTFEGGKYAVYHFKGFPQFLFMIYQEVFCRWLSKTGNQLDNRPIFDIYRNIGEDGYMEIDICFPLK